MVLVKQRERERDWSDGSDGSDHSASTLPVELPPFGKFVEVVL